MAQMERTKFLELSTRLMQDLRAWIDEAKEYYDLSPDRLTNLLTATEYIDHVTTEVAKVKDVSEDKA